MFLALAHRTIACRDMYCVPLMLFVYIVCIRCLLIVYFQLVLIVKQGCYFSVCVILVYTVRLYLLLCCMNKHSNFNFNQFVQSTYVCMCLHL